MNEIFFVIFPAVSYIFFLNYDGIDQFHTPV